jgi:hypothetical protein
MWMDPFNNAEDDISDFNVPGSGNREDSVDRILNVIRNSTAAGAGAGPF